MHSGELKKKNCLIPRTKIKVQRQVINKSRSCNWKGGCQTAIAARFSAIDVCESKCAQMCAHDGVNDSNLKSLRFFLSLSFSGDSSSIAQFRNRGRRGGISRSDLCEWHELPRRLITNHRLIMRVVEAQAFYQLIASRLLPPIRQQCVFQLEAVSLFLVANSVSKSWHGNPSFFINETFLRVGKRKSIKNPYVIVPRRGERAMVYYIGPLVNYFHRLIG